MVEVELAQPTHAPTSLTHTCGGGLGAEALIGTSAGDGRGRVTVGVVAEGAVAMA